MLAEEHQDLLWDSVPDILTDLIHWNKGMFENVALKALGWLNQYQQDVCAPYRQVLYLLTCLWNTCMIGLIIELDIKLHLSEPIHEPIKYYPEQTGFDESS